jgi:hypothetical protein
MPRTGIALAAISEGAVTRTIKVASSSLSYTVSTCETSFSRQLRFWCSRHEPVYRSMFFSHLVTIRCIRATFLLRNDWLSVSIGALLW